MEKLDSLDCQVIPVVGANQDALVLGGPKRWRREERWLEAELSRFRPLCRLLTISIVGLGSIRVFLDELSLP